MSRRLASEEDRRVMFGLSIQRKILKQLDLKRGLIPRSAYVEKLIVEHLAKA